AVYLAEARRLGIKVLPPDVNASGERFAATSEGVRFGLGAVRDVGAAALAKILEAREAGPFTGPADFCARTGAGRRALEALTRAGAFSALGVSRAGLAGRVDDVLGVGEALRKLRALGEFDLHGPLPVPDLYDGGTAVELDAGEWPRVELLAAEREVLGLYVSGHPLEGLEPLLAEHRSAPVADVLAVVAGDGEQTVTVTGVVIRAECKVTKAGRAWVSATVEDLDAAITILVFRRTEELAPLLTVDAVVAVRGRLNHRDEEVSVVADQVTVLDTLSGDRPAPVVLDVPAVAGDMAMERLAAVLVEHPGPVPVWLRTECGAVLELTGAGVDASEGFMVAAMAALGEVG
ncbi:MAG: OB-fold nucleic acid binding domain-containing protein, partial [Pseudonocardiaceae bacterium]